MILCAEYPELEEEEEGKVVCSVCRVELDWTKRSRINEHLRSQKHSRARRAEDAATSQTKEELREEKRCDCTSDYVNV